MLRIAFALIGLTLLAPALHAQPPPSIVDLAARARSVAGKWQADARLVEIEVGAFGFALDPSGMPEMDKLGPPGLVTFNFYSPSRQQAFRVVAQPNLTPAQLDFLRKQGGGDFRAEKLPMPYSPFTLPLPDKLLDLQPAVAAAQSSGIAHDCQGLPVYYGCTRVTSAELHAYWEGSGESGIPVWKINFGQDAKARQVTREIDAESGRLVAIADMQGQSIDGQGEQHIAAQSATLSVGADLAAIVPTVTGIVAKQDPIYKLYAAAVTASLGENAHRTGPVQLRQAWFEYARLTPSLRWDNVEVHVEWTSENRALVNIADAQRHTAPLEPKPTPLGSAVPDSDAVLRKLLAVFPAGYYEQFTTYERGCHQLPSITPEIRTTECGVLLPVEHHTDEMFFWLTRQGNPYWFSHGGPLQSEYLLINRSLPSARWDWWTRVKQHGQWQYHAIDVAGSAEPTVCVPPVEAASTALPATVACR